MSGIVDLHSHVLPGIDDGPADLAGSIALAELAAETGTEILVATPHVREDYPDVRPGEIAERVDALTARLREAGILLDVRVGGELGVGRAAALSDQELRQVSLGGAGRWLLLETPHEEMPGIFEELVAGIRARGFEVLLAHPELSPTLQRDPARLERLVEQGCRLQLTSRSLLRPERRSRIRRLAEQALEAGWASVLASDAHAVEWRPPELGSHVAQIADRHPHLAAELRWMVSDVPRALIEDATVPPRPPRTGERPRRGFWRRD